MALFACRCAVLLALIPPWQQPDEHMHVSIAQVSHSRLISSGSPDPGRQREILESMAQYDWWRFYGTETPAVLPTTFVAAGESLGIDPTVDQLVPKTYYFAVGGIQSLLPPLSVVDALYLMRVLSSLLAIATIWVAWLGARESLGEKGGVTVAVLLALHPQFAVSSTTAGPDTVVNFAGACLWWQALRAIHRTDITRPVAAVWTAAVGAAVSDRTGVPLLVSAFLVSIVAILKTGLRRSSVMLGLGMAALAGVCLSLLELFWHPFRQAMWTRVIPVPAALDWDFFGTFTYVLVEGWWLTLGWARYRPPFWWMSIPIALGVWALVGVVRRLSRGDNPRLRVDIGVMLMLLAVQVSAVYWVYFRIAHGPQGRHLFAFLVPALVLMWIGVEEWVPIRYRRHAAVGLVFIFALLDSTAWLFVAVPIYAG